MKYYIGEIETYFGESVVNTMVKFKTNSHPDEFLDMLASKFWGDLPEQAGDGTVSMYDYGDRMTSAGRWQEVDKKTFIALHIISELLERD